MEATYSIKSYKPFTVQYQYGSETKEVVYQTYLSKEEILLELPHNKPTINQPKNQFNMKRVLTAAIFMGAIVALLLACSSCKKDNQKQATPTTNNTVGLTTDEQAIAGNWVLQWDEYWQGGSMQSHTNHSDPINCHLNLQSSQSAANVSQGAHDCTFALTCTSASYGWKLESGYLDIWGNQYYIQAQTDSTLQLKGPGSAYFIYYLTK